MAEEKMLDRIKNAYYAISCVLLSFLVSFFFYVSNTRGCVSSVLHFLHIEHIKQIAVNDIMWGFVEFNIFST